MEGIFGEDCLLNGSTAEFEDLDTYSKTLHRLKDAFKQADDENKLTTKCFPSYGDVINDGVRMTEGYLKHRATREKQFLQALFEFGEGGTTTWELTKKVHGNAVGFLVLMTSCHKITTQHM